MYHVVHLLAPRVIYEYVKLVKGVILQNFKNHNTWAYLPHAKISMVL